MQYDLYNTDADYTCTTPENESNVCYCPKDYSGVACEIPHIHVCALNVTDPPLYERCNEKDSHYYWYSIPGFDPCHPIRMDEPYDIKLKVDCSTQIASGQTKLNEAVRYSYIDVVQTGTPAEPFIYFAERDTDLAMSLATTI